MKEEGYVPMNNSEYIKKLLSYDSIVEYMVYHLIIAEDTRLFRNSVLQEIKEAYIGYRLFNRDYKIVKSSLQKVLTTIGIDNVFTKDQLEQISMKLKFEII